MAKPFRALKYMGDDESSWAVFRSSDIEKGHRGPYCGEAQPLIAGLTQSSAQAEVHSLTTVMKGKEK